MRKSKKPYNVQSGVKSGYYCHSKSGVIYEVSGVSLHTETQETLVHYHNLDRQEFSRPYASFVENVDVDGGRYQRFEFLGSDWDDVIARLAEDLHAVRAAERISSRIVAEGHDVLVKAGILVPAPEPVQVTMTECALITTGGLSGTQDCKGCKEECFFDSETRERAIAERSRRRPGVYTFEDEK